MTTLATLLLTASVLAVAHVLVATVAPALPRMIDLLRKDM